MQSSDNFRLIVRRGPQPNQVYDLNKDIITIGRDITNDITINDPEVSRHHLRFTRGAGGFTLEDLGSTNGTFVNGQRLTGAKPLNNGDMLGLGETVTLGYEMARGAAPAGQGQAPMVGGQPPAPAAGQPYSPYSPQAAQQPPPQQAQQPQSPYAPPAQQPQAPSYSPQPASYGQQNQPQQPAYGQQQGQPQSAAGGYNPPPPPGAAYDYDPYAVREEEPRSMTRWVAIGCVAVSVLCCCATFVSLVVIDYACLWNRIPLLGDLVKAVGYNIVCK